MAPASRNSATFRTARPCAWGIGSNVQAKVETTILPSAHDINSGNTGGWDPETGEFEKEINAQIDLAFANVERCLKDTGGKGWSQVYRVNSYHVPINNEALAAMVRNFRKYMPDHQPIWTCVGVTRLGEDDMRVEIEVVAHDPTEA
ncbi:YjgF-like protein [Aspergillus sclerotioniger CBS 115572]|uniref:YjgF-like protein n=1 Tax=Aspergillus sclerotioniger CBS 115572 TaxID=1450535 RepID=A0A317WNV5_9EURO|nr:YjgF-like protein [Aspergillus sclerotioniger CBS 115572]PWY88116.1 YjgF-like protein [Aspergillus sclerotioniger CBS 115572]